MYNFQVRQKDSSKILSAFHILVALIFVLDLSHIQRIGKEDWTVFIVLLVASIVLFLATIFRKKILPILSRHLALLLAESALILGSSIYFWSKGASLVAFSHAILAGAIILFWIYLKKREDGERIFFSDEQIIVPGLAGERIIDWNELTNVVKKYDLVTLDFKNNKLLQVQVMEAMDINDEEFNLYCRERLAKK